MPVQTIQLTPTTRLEIKLMDDDVDIRKFVHNGDHRGWLPTVKGIRFDRTQLPQVLEALRQLQPTGAGDLGIGGDQCRLRSST